MPRDPRDRRAPHPAVAEPLEQRLLLSADLPGLVELSDAVLRDQPAPHVQLLEDDAVARSEERLEVVFVDGGIDGYERLVESLLVEDARDDTRRFEVVVLDPGADGIDQIGGVLAGMTGVDAVHVISHGEDGGLRLGNASLSAETLEQLSVRLKGWGDALADDADLLFYGCDLASGEKGRELTREISRLTGADVAASDDLTGSALLGGDWDLEQRVGEVSTALALGEQARAHFDQVLATNTLYLGGDAYPVDGLSSQAPTAPTPGNVDPARDADPGILVARGGSGVGETDPTRYQLWNVYADAVRLNGPTSLTLYSAMQGFDTALGGSITAYLVDCDANGGDCTEIASATVARADWDAADTGGWIEDGFDFGTVDYTLGQGRYLGVKIVVDGAAADDMWIAVDSTATPSRLVYEGTTHALDQFETGDYTGDDGSHPWTGIWNDSEPINSPTLGEVRIVSGELRFGDGTNDFFSGHTATRGVDLTGAVSATLSYDYRRELVSSPGGSMELQVRSGGGAWTTLQTYSLNGTDGSAVHESFDITPWIASDTEFRFEGFGTMVDSRFFVDNVQVAFETTLPTTNEAPVNLVPGAQQMLVDESLVFSVAGGNAISVSDDAGSEDIQVTLSVTDGALTLSQSSGLSFIAGDGSADATMTFTGSQADINAALDGLQYHPTAAWTGSATLTITTNDLGNPTTAALDGDPSLTTRYRFEVDGSDDAGSNDATLVGGAAVVSDPDRGNVLYTDGSNDYAEVPTGVTAGLTEYSFSLWVRTTESGSDFTYWQRPTFFGMHSNPVGDGDMLLTTNDGYVGFWTGRSGASLVYQSTTTRINDDQWHQITVTDDGTMAVLYVDGVLEGSLASGPQPLESMAFRVGAASNGFGTPDLHHQGYYDDVRIFERALSPGEVANLYALEDTDTVTIDVLANTVPVLTANALAITQGQTVTLSAGDLAATDAEHADADLRFTVGNVTGGHFELSGSATTTFLQSDVTAGNVRFVHDGGEAAPSYEVSVSDGSLSTTPVAASVTFTNVNDPPVLGNNSLTVDENQTVTLGAGDLSATDPDDPDADLRFTVSSVTGGHFELSGSATTTFLQSDVTAGNVRFVHDGGELAPGYEVSVSDGALATTPSAAIITFSANEPDPPVLIDNDLTLEEGETVVIQTVDLSAIDSDTWHTVLRFIPSNVTGGHFELDGVPTASFEQRDIVQGRVTFVHDGGEAAPSYDISVDDGTTITTPATALITFTNVNDVPVLGSNSLTIAEGDTVTLGAGDLSATDPDDPDADLRFTMSGVTGGHFELSGAATTTFLQSDVTAGNVRFVHDGGELAPSYDVSVSDGALATAPAAATITFTSQNDAPVLGNNSLTITEGQAVTLGSGDLSATDPDDLDADLRFTMSGVTGGHFELSGSATTTFLQSDVAAGNVRFVHDGGEAAPSYDVSVGDGALATAPAAATITFTSLNDAPVLGSNSLTIVEGQTVTLSATDLSATDIDDLDADLRFTVGNVTGGHFELSGSATTTFLQSDVTAGNVRFVHDGGEAAPSYDVSVGDGALATAPAAATITFTSLNDAPFTQVPGLQTTSEDVDLVFSTATGNALVVGDLDDGTLTVDLVASGGTVSLASTAGLTLQSGSGSADASVRMTGSLADLNAALDGLRFTPTPDYNGPAQIAVEASDGIMLQNGLALIDVVSVNDAPWLSMPGSEVTDEGLPLAFSSLDGNAISVGDVDGGIVTVTLSAADGTFDLAGTTGLVFGTGSGSGDATVSFSGTAADVNAALDGMRFLPSAGFSGATNVQVQVSDGSLAQVRDVTIEVTELLVELPISPGDFEDGQDHASDEAADADPDTASASEPTETGAGRPPLPVGHPGGDVPDRLDGELETGLAALGFGDDDGDDALGLGAILAPYELRDERVDLDPTALPWGLRGLEPPLFEALERMREDMMEDLRRSAFEDDVIVSSAESAAIVLGVSVLAGLLRSSSLFALSLSSLPLWMRMDPLAILSLSDDEREKRRRELEEAEWDEDRVSGLDRILRPPTAV